MARLLPYVYGMTDRPARLATFSYVGLHRYSLTFCVRERKTVFTEALLVAAMLGQISHAARDWAFAVLAYCFMPDHLHLLVDAVSDESKLKPFAKMAKQRSGASHALCGHGRLWHEGFWDQVLRKDADPSPTIRYIFENPVRARLVKTPRDYPHLGSDVWPLEQLLDLCSSLDR